MADSSKVISGAIGTEAVTLSQGWGAAFNDYSITSGAGATRKVDFQDILISVSEYRAVTVEDEVQPLTVRIRNRNKLLDQLGDVLAELTKHQASFKSDDEGNIDMTGWISKTTGDFLSSKLGFGYTTYWSSDEDDPGGRPEDRDERAGFYYATWANAYSANKMTVEEMIQKAKSTIDGLNNRAQLDMTRLQSLVDRRDESYSTASNLMNAVSDTRSNTIRNM